MEQAYELGIKQRKENLFDKIENYEYGRYINEVYDYFDDGYNVESIPISILEDIEKKIDKEKNYSVTYKRVETFKVIIGAKNANQAKEIFLDSLYHTGKFPHSSEYLDYGWNTPFTSLTTFVGVRKCKED